MAEQTKKAPSLKLSQDSQVIAVDPGKFSVKAVSADGKSLIRSKVLELASNEMYVPEGESVLISYDGRNYIFGDQGADRDTTLDKATILHKVGLMSALSRLVHEGSRVDLVLGTPAQLFRDRELREGYKNFMTDGGRISFDAGSKSYEVVFGSVKIMPESAGTVYSHPDVFSGVNAAVIDLGGLNLNFSAYNDMTLDIGSLATVNHGAFTLQSMLRKVFATQYQVGFSDDILNIILKNRRLVLNGKEAPRSSELFDEVLRHFVRKIPEIIRSLDYDLSLYDRVVFSGGTSSLLGEDLIKSVLPHAVLLPDSVWANAEGFYEVGRLSGGQG